jgi:prevent-host-death family protein
MTTVAAREAKRQFGLLIDTSQREPVTIEKHGRPVAVVVSKHDYDAIQAQLADYRAWRETAHLLSTDANREALRESVAELNRGATVEATLADLKLREH